MTIDQHALAARDRVNDALVGLIAVGTLYALTFLFLSVPLAMGFMGVWAGWVAAGFALRTRRPDLVRCLVYAEVGAWLVLVLVLNLLNIS